jgi:hypothetical protein
MTVEEALELIEKTKLGYNQKLRVLRGIQILSEHDEDLDIGIVFEHDQMWAGDFEATVYSMTKEEIVEMALLGWFEADGSWSHY